MTHGVIERDWQQWEQSTAPDETSESKLATFSVVCKSVFMFLWLKWPWRKVDRSTVDGHLFISLSGCCCCCFILFSLTLASCCARFSHCVQCHQEVYTSWHCSWPPWMCTDGGEKRMKDCNEGLFASSVIFQRNSSWPAYTWYNSISSHRLLRTQPC